MGWYCQCFAQEPKAMRSSVPDGKGARSVPASAPDPSAAVSANATAAPASG
jgi:hypothetical protein